MTGSLRMDPAVLLISPGIIKWTDMDFGLPHLVSMGGYLQHHVDVRVELLDLNYEGGDHRQLATTIASLGPFLCIGLSCYSSFDYMRVMALARFIKELYPDVPLLTGGYHATALPGDMVFDGSPFDAVIVGEGEVPLLGVVQTLLAGERLDRQQFGPAHVTLLDEMPPYKWELLARYWPRCKQIGRKLQVYLSRGCPYHCSFCMERVKADYRWRAFSPDRAVDELKRLSRFTDLRHWLVNIADPLFGFEPKWRRAVLQGIIDNNLVARQYWTLTRADNLQEEDVALLARARFSIGIGLESGSPEMLRKMNKGNKPERYLEAILALARMSRKHGMSWAANVIVGHPGETLATMQQTHAFLGELFTTAPETCGWLSIDPFRLYPGSQIHQEMARYEAEEGTVFHHPRWWDGWYDAPFHAGHVDPSRTLSFQERVRFMYDNYGPMLQRVQRSFVGQGRSVDRIFERSMENQVLALGPQVRDGLLRSADRARGGAVNAKAADKVVATPWPLGLHVKDGRVRRREEAVRRLLERGFVRSQRLIEALLQVAPEDLMSEDQAVKMLRDVPAELRAEGQPPTWLGVGLLAMSLEALEPEAGDRVLVLPVVSGYVAALLGELVSGHGQVVAMSPGRWLGTRQLARNLKPWRQIELVTGDCTVGPAAKQPFDGIWLGGAVPRFPKPLVSLLHDPGGRAVAFVGARFGRQDLVDLQRNGDKLAERRVARVRVPVLAGLHGWIRRPS